MFQSYYEVDLIFVCLRLDLIAIYDFKAGAMENWGLITFRDVYILYAPERSSTVNQEQVASVVVHELAHQVCEKLLYFICIKQMWVFFS